MARVFGTTRIKSRPKRLAASLKISSMVIVLGQIIAMQFAAISVAYADTDHRANKVDHNSGAHMDSAEQAVMAVLDKYMAAVNRIDLTGVTDTYHFPHYRFVNEKVEIWHTPLEAMPMLSLPLKQQKKAMVDALGPDWNRTEWQYRRVLSLSENKAHVDTALVRIDSKDNIIKVFESLYIVTKENNRWAIKGRSSFAPR